MKRIPVGSEFAVVDDCDYEELSQYTWRLSRERGRTYVVRWGCQNGRKSNIRMHRQIISTMGLNPSGQDIDHKDGCGLNNCRSNLRIASRSQNNGNMRRPKDNTSGFKGVYWHKLAKKWQAYISCGGKRHHLGLFTDLQQAAKAYNDAAVHYFGEFARLNPIS